MLAALFVTGRLAPGHCGGGRDVGPFEGRHRRFAGGGVIPAVLVALAAPWVMVAYTLGYGIARLFPPAQSMEPVGWPRLPTAPDEWRPR